MSRSYISGNHLLDALSSDDGPGLGSDIEIVALPARRWLAPYGGPRHHVDFPIDAVISIVATLRSGDAIEVGTIGREGFMETDAALESDTARRGSFCQVSGDVARMTLPRFRERMDDNGAFARLMRRSVTATLFNVQQLAACNAKHRVEAQCARWLLMTHDRVGADVLPLTHEYLAMMLGVQRNGVTAVLQHFRGLGLVEYARGRITVLDRAGL
ncbi:MAG TPA: Crp/Fnr family transcriptional regulator, partial [Candidatus Elarobacter sp.]